MWDRELEKLQGIRPATFFALSCIDKHKLVSEVLVFGFFSVFLGMLVGHVTLRLLKPECELDQAWEQEDLDTAALRTILLLHNHSVPQREAKTNGE